MSNGFVRLGWPHRPASLAGWLISVAALAYMAQVFLAIDAHSHSVSDTLYAIYPHWGITFLGWNGWPGERRAQTRV